MSVVESDWESLKRFNLAELYQLAKRSANAEAMPESAKTNEASDSLGA